MLGFLRLVVFALVASLGIASGVHAFEAKPALRAFSSLAGSASGDAACNAAEGVGKLALSVRRTHRSISFNRFRYYDAEAGQYVTQDPIGLLGGLRLNGYVRDPNAAFDPLGLKSCRPTSKRVFWSGGDVSREAAEDWAKKNGYTTLEMTATARRLARTTQGKDWFGEARPKWANASERYAKGSRGDVQCFSENPGCERRVPVIRARFGRSANIPR